MPPHSVQGFPVCLPAAERGPGRVIWSGAGSTCVGEAEIFTIKKGALCLASLVWPGSSGEQKAGTTNYVGLTFGLESHFGELLLLVLKCREKVIPNTFLVL